MAVGSGGTFLMLGESWGKFISILAAAAAAATTLVPTSAYIID